MNDQVKKNQTEKDELDRGVRKPMLDYESFMKKRKAGSITAEGVALIRAADCKQI